ncbi:MAG: CRISPR-associated helicase Cas3' [Nitrosomonas sp.]|uniref:CRISPR-associated helicase Cas3' n=1 Tax=Nitrosomonas sp. TaxID=42353 RepID=UPI001D21A380|nr:CRISPR-associated helicase Cas3' [Nitrosomonas sp.]MBX9895406.1 CRISPR-associated helicase Cas3' [Nitrosomonas sp.]
MIYAHSANDLGNWHPLKEHLTSVARIAKHFSSDMEWQDEAFLAGLLHDLGKYADRFQTRLKGLDSGLDHWSQGAWVALDKEHRAIAAALVIQGHHIGLQQGNPDALRRLNPINLSQNHPLKLELSHADVAELKKRAEADGLEFQKPATTAVPVDKAEQIVASMLDVRMLFSCLVDADFLDTEAHFNGDANGKRFRPEGPKLGVASALAALDSFMSASIRNGNQADENVLQVREKLWQEMINASSASNGLFTLTAPTGSGKTLAMLKFALEHVVANKNLKRIVLVVPFLTIIEQTARIYRAVFQGFPENYVLEHHSMAGLGCERATTDAEDNKNNASERQRRLLSENWDAPIVLTTNVQLLESLFSNRPSSCRKLHNLMNSVILFDEAQSLPQHLAVPTLAALSHLSIAYRSSVVFATATQPAFDTLHQAVIKESPKGWQPNEIVRNNSSMFSQLKRVRVRWPVNGEKTSWNTLTQKLSEVKQVLCVVNLKRHAAELLDALKDIEGVYHLSTNQCAEHRRVVLENVRTRLKAGKPCRLISTQCVEAGVDLDFPLVYRALAPLESIAQAAGRCNREGRMNTQGKLGEVIVFEPEEEISRRCYPTYAYYQAAEKTRTLLKIHHGELDINNPELYREYYQQLYDLTKPESQNERLREAITARDFAEVARLYKLIDHDAIQILVPWEGKLDEFTALLAEADRKGISSGWMRRAQSIAVSIYRPQAGHPAGSILIPAKLRRGGVSDEWFILQDSQKNHYHAIRGLQLPQSEQIFIA